MEDISKWADLLKYFTDSVVGPVTLILIPAVITLWYKITKGLDVITKRLRKMKTDRLEDFEIEMSRKIIEEIGFFLDGIQASPYCKADQIVYLGLENGVVGPAHIHSMFLSTHAETTGISRCVPKASEVQRVPYTAMAVWCDDTLKAGILKVSKIEEYPPAKVLKVHSDAKSFIVAPILTKEKWFAGALVFNFFDEDFNYQSDISKMDEPITAAKVFIEGQLFHAEIARKKWLKENNL